LLSVVVGSVESALTIEACLSALTGALRGVDAEVLLVDASGDGTRRIAGLLLPCPTLISRPEGTLVPDLWSEGIRASRGRYVALTTGHCIVPESWARALLAELEGGAGAAGAGLLPQPGIGAVDRAVFYLRYAGFLPLTRGPVREVEEVPGDNAAYPGDALRSYVAENEGGGFWEVDFHRRLRADGGRLVAVPEATARFGRSFPLAVIARHRFAHGRHYGEWKVRVGGQAAPRALAAIPAIPPLFLARAARAVLREPAHLRGLLTSALPFLLLAGAWGAGEGLGAIEALRASRRAAG
jgi:hypothetical protein